MAFSSEQSTASFENTQVCDKKTVEENKPIQATVYEVDEYIRFINFMLISDCFTAAVTAYRIKSLSSISLRTIYIQQFKFVGMWIF